MKKIILFSSFILLLPLTSFPQSCLPEGITFTTQAQIDSFQVNYPGCIEIEGNLTINGENIINLYGLSVLNFIGGNLVIEYNPLLSKLEGLNNLASIGGAFVIEHNYSLTSLCTFKKFEFYWWGFRYLYEFSAS